MRFRIALLAFLFPLILFAQKKMGHAPFFKSFNAKKLAHALTDGLENDSLKVRSIYLWETRHIKYDVRAYGKGRPSHDKPRKILFHRKAVCLGYSILFDSLCHYANVNSEMVLGYTYAPWYEARDTFFLDNHAWNVAMINGNWKLLDVTWASGYVKPRRQFVRLVLYYTLRIPYRQKYRFKRQRNDFYFATPPERFVEKHLPSTPAWQLLPCSVPVDSFQLSPTAVMHFLRGHPAKCAEGNDSIASIEAEPKCRRQLAMGKQAVFYNDGNHQDISLGYWYYGETLFLQAENKKDARVDRIVMYDSTMHQMDSAAKCFKQTAVNAKQEQAFFLARNKRMRQQVIDENKPLIERQNLYLRELRRERIYARMKCTKLKKENRHLKKLSRQFQRQRLHTRRPDNPKSNEAQVTRILLDTIDSTNQTIALTGDSTRAFLYSNREPLHYDSCLIIKKKTISRQIGFQGSLCLMRRFFLLNSYDTITINTKEVVFASERKMDSLDKALLKGKDWQVNKNNRNYSEKVKAMDVLFASNVKVCKQLAHLTETSYSEDSVFREQKKQYAAWNDSMINENKKLIQAYHNYYLDLKRLRKFHRRALKRYHKEIGAEISRCSITNAFFRGYYGSISDVMKHNAGKCRKVKAYCKAKRNKLQYEENKANKKAGTSPTT